WVGDGFATDRCRPASWYADTCTPVHPTDLTYTAQAIQKDTAGNTGKSLSRTFTVKTGAPAVTLEPVASPTNNAMPTLGGVAGTRADERRVGNETRAQGTSDGGAAPTSVMAV